MNKIIFLALTLGLSGVLHAQNQSEQDWVRSFQNQILAGKLDGVQQLYTQSEKDKRLAGFLRTNGNFLLGNAISNRQSAIAQFFISKGFYQYTSYSGYTLLHQAARNGDVESARMLIAKGIDVDAISKADGTRDGGIGASKITPLFEAVKSGNLELVKLLVDHGANLNAKATYGRTLLHFAADCARCANIVEFLISKGLQVDEKDEYGRTPLEFAVNNPPYQEEREHKGKIVDVLLKHGANPDGKTHFRRTYEQEALLNNDQTTLELLRLAKSKRSNQNSVASTNCEVFLDIAEQFMIDKIPAYVVKPLLSSATSRVKDTRAAAFALDKATLRGYLYFVSLSSRTDIAPAAQKRFQEQLSKLENELGGRKLINAALRQNAPDLASDLVFIPPTVSSISEEEVQARVGPDFYKHIVDECWAKPNLKDRQETSEPEKTH